MTDPDPDFDPVLALFRDEVRAAVADLSRALAADPVDPAAVGDAARAVRGAARIVGLSPAGDLAAAVEARAAAVLAGAADPGLGDLARRATELFGELCDQEPAAWADAHGDEAATLASGPRERAVAASVAQPTPPSVAVDPQPTPAAEPTPPVPVAPRSVQQQPAHAGRSPGPPEPAFVPPPVDPAMLELFREEVRSHAAHLSAGLLELEREPTNPQKIEPLMRAAHSLKGACRIVGIDPAVQLAHEMEDVFVAAGAGKLRVSAAGIDVFLRAADLLAALGIDDPARWCAARAADIRTLRTVVAAVGRGEEPPAAAVVASATSAPTAATAATAAIGGQPAAEPPTPSPPHPLTPSSPPPPPSEEAVVRVTAQSLTRLMSLAGESLVQARWLQPFASALFELKKLQDQIAARLDVVSQRHPDESAVADARQLSARCRKVLADRIGEFEDHAGRAEDLNTRLYREVIVSRMRPFGDCAHGFPRLVRDTARMLGKPVRLDLVGQTTDVDRDILEKLEAPLTHLLRNAVDHGIEPPEVRAAAGKPAEGVIRVEARHRGGMLSITVTDDGGGIEVERLRRKVTDRGHASPAMAARMSDAELLEFLFLPGFSTASQVTEVSGRGVGLDVVQDTVRRVGGSVQISTAVGKGTTFHLMLPLTLSVVRAVLVEVAGEPYAFPHNRIDRLLMVPPGELKSLQNRQFVTVDGRGVGLVLASQLFDVTVQAPPSGGELPVVLLSDAGGSYGLIVDAFRGEQDLVVRPLDPRLGKVPNVSAAAILDDGSPVLIADVEDLIRSMDQFIQTGTLRRFDPGQGRQSARKRVLVVDDSITVREVQKQILKGRGYDVEVAVDGADGWNKVRADKFDLVVSDVDMPRMTGLEFVRRIRDDAKLKELPVVIVSYKDREEDRLRGLEAGASHYLTKSSFHDESFVDAVATLIGPG